MLPFNKPYLSGEELEFIEDAINSGHLSGNGKYTKKCQNWFNTKYGFKHSLLTSSCTDALEMCAILLNIQPGDEVILPSYTFVSTANAFALRGAKLIFVDSRFDHPGVDERCIANAITEKTKAIVVVHYAGVACDMDYIMEVADKYEIPVVEDAAQAIDNFYISKSGERRALGSIGQLATFSFHETKNIISGEGGLLVINDSAYIDRAEIIWEKGTNRSSFFRGEINKYGWVDIGSSFLPSELTAAFLWGQLSNIRRIQQKRIGFYHTYLTELSEWANKLNIRIPFTPEYSIVNGHMFYLVCTSIEQRNALITHLKVNQIHAVFHYISLHKSDYYLKDNEDLSLPNCEKYSDCLVRLPLYYELDIQRIIDVVKKFKDE